MLSFEEQNLIKIFSYGSCFLCPKTAFLIQGHNEFPLCYLIGALHLSSYIWTYDPFRID